MLKALRANKKIIMGKITWIMGKITWIIGKKTWIMGKKTINIKVYNRYIDFLHIMLYLILNR